MPGVASSILAKYAAAFQGASAVEIKNPDPLLHHLLMTHWRHYVQTDWLLRQRTRGRTRPMVYAVLSWGVEELLWSRGLPAGVAVDCAVEYAKEHGASREAGFVNAVLRGISRDREAGKDLFAEAEESVRYGLPPALWKRWCGRYGVEKTISLAEILQQEAEVVLRRGRGREADVAGLTPLAAPDWCPSAELYSLGTREIGALMEDGAFYIQDPATLLAPTLLAVQPGEAVADLCCAPGGKARMLAEALEGQGSLFCLEKEEAKLPRLRENLRFFANVEICGGDASTFELPTRRFDAILLDVPCSNTGVVRRRPDVRKEFTEGRLQAHAALQKRILEHASLFLRPGGRLVYSTCSLEPEENALQVRSFLRRHQDFVLEAEREIFPSPENDGAYAARLVRRGVK